jgi:hypothetical protein
VFQLFLPDSLGFGVWDLDLWRLLVAQASPINLTTKTLRHKGRINPLFLVSAFRLSVPIRAIRVIPARRRPGLPAEGPAQAGAGRRGQTPMPWFRSSNHFTTDYTDNADF